MRRALIALVLTSIVASCIAVEDTHNPPGQPGCEPGLRADCVGASLKGVDLAGADLTLADFRGADLSGADLTGANLRGANFATANLADANLANTSAVDTRFDSADLRRASFTGAVLLGASLAGANLDAATFEQAHLTFTDVTGSEAAEFGPALVCELYDGPSIIAGVCDPLAPYTETLGPAVIIDGGEEDLLGDTLDLVAAMLSRTGDVNPLVAARVYAYVGLAGGVAAGDTRLSELLQSRKINIETPAQVDRNIAITSAATFAAVRAFRAADIGQLPGGNSGSLAFETGARRARTREQILYAQRDLQAARREDLPYEVVRNSVLWGTRIGAAVVDELMLRDRADDTYRAAGSFRSELDSGSSGIFQWEPAPPSFQQPLGPQWARIRPILLPDDGPSVCALDAPFPQKSEFERNQALSNELDYIMDLTSSLSDDEFEVALFWDDALGSSGTPAGHWLQISRLAAAAAGLNSVEAAVAHAYTVIIIHDTNIETWREKFKWDLVRPVTLAKRLGFDGWKPFLATPPHPEYPSGHASLSMAAAITLKHYVGDVEFVDSGFNLFNSAVNWITFEPRTYTTFRQAAEEAAYSRVVGGIHYPISMEAGLELGRCVARTALNMEEDAGPGS